MSGNSLRGQDDDRYMKRNTSYDLDSAATVARAMERHGRNWSQTVCLLIAASEGNARLLRHSAAQPLNALRCAAEILHRRGLAEEADVLSRAVRDLETILSP